MRKSPLGDVGVLFAKSAKLIYGLNYRATNAKPLHPHYKRGREVVSYNSYISGKTTSKEQDQILE
ncbi:MAG: hypothetical protein JXA53_01945, partial [Bacteroidales bacterium]|nr:hypothetical protein [Bacteroidales bacterium]